MIRDNEIRLRLAAVLANRLSLEDFEDWLVQNSWNMHRDTDEGTQQLVADIELRLAEFSNDHLDEQELRRELNLILISGNRFAIRYVAIARDITESRTATVSSTFDQPLPVQYVSLGNYVVTSSETCSAAGLTKLGEELLRQTA